MSADVDLSLPLRIYDEIEAYHARTGYWPSLADVVIGVRERASIVRAHVAVLIAQGYVVGPLSDLRTIRRPVEAEQVSQP